MFHLTQRLFNSEWSACSAQVDLFKLSATIAVVTAFLGQPLFGDVFFDDRLSRIEYSSTNLGGADGLIESTDLSPFDAQLIGSQTHIEPGGAINDGVWGLSQETTIGQDMISTIMSTSTAISGNGSGVLSSSNTFEIEFVVDQLTRFDLNGNVSGNLMNVGAEDFVRVQLQRWNGVTFVTQFVTSTDSVIDETGMLDPWTEYRLNVFSRANSTTNVANFSSAEVDLMFTSIPEPAALPMLAVVTCMSWVRRRRSSIGSM